MKLKTEKDITTIIQQDEWKKFDCNEAISA